MYKYLMGNWAEINLSQLVFFLFFNFFILFKFRTRQKIYGILKQKYVFKINVYVWILVQIERNFSLNIIWDCQCNLEKKNFLKCFQNVHKAKDPTNTFFFFYFQKDESYLFPYEQISFRCKLLNWTVNSSTTIAVAPPSPNMNE